jgi:hypothetical protein
MAAAIEHYQKIGKRIDWRKLPHKVVAAIKDFGESTQQGTPDEKIEKCAVCDAWRSGTRCLRDNCPGWRS